MVDIKNRNLFFDNLKRGINIFTGAGFSKLQSPSEIFCQMQVSYVNKYVINSIYLQHMLKI